MTTPLQMLKAIKNPKQFVMNLMQKNSNPIFSNLIDMANKGDTQELENFARNVFKEHNQNFDEEFSNFMNTFKK